jgi:hypothetical protein
MKHAHGWLLSVSDEHSSGFPSRRSHQPKSKKSFENQAPSQFGDVRKSELVQEPIKVNIVLGYLVKPHNFGTPSYRAENQG